MIQFSFHEALLVIKPLLLYSLGVIFYAVFIFKFYRFLAKKDVFGLDLSEYKNSKHPILKKLFHILLMTFKYLFIFPLFIFFWFIVLAIFLVFLSKGRDLGSVLMLSMAIVAAVRATSYYNEDLSKDLAKMLPFTLLGIFIIDITYFSFSEGVDLLFNIPDFGFVLIYYLIFIVALELLLRVAHWTIMSFFLKTEENFK